MSRTSFLGAMYASRDRRVAPPKVNEDEQIDSLLSELIGGPPGECEERPAASTDAPPFFGHLERTGLFLREELDELCLTLAHEHVGSALDLCEVLTSVVNDTAIGVTFKYRRVVGNGQEPAAYCRLDELASLVYEDTGKYHRGAEAQKATGKRQRLEAPADAGGPSALARLAWKREFKSDREKLDMPFKHLIDETVHILVG